MEYLLDTGNYDDISTVLQHYPIDGITTNPTIVSKEKGSYKEILQNLDKLLDGRQFHIQLTSLTHDEMVKEALAYKELIHSDLYIKILVSKEGLSAIKTLSDLGVKVTGTAVTSLNQGVMAAKAGAKYLAVYCNRISNTGQDGNQVIKQIADILKRDGHDTKIVGASYKSVYQVNDSIMSGCDAVTVPADLFWQMMETTVTTNSVKQFDVDILHRFGAKGLDLLKE